MKHLNIHVHGMVQGVFFRSNTEKQAAVLGINGFVRNESDGTVYIEAEGSEGDLDKLVAWAHHGPDACRVDKVEIEEGELVNFDSFETRFL